MEERKYRYDAFISYRHTELDKFVAENLIKQLEAYKLPKSVAKKLKGKKTKIERVFRDREELPLTNNLEEPIVEALENSEWLIVICSPRLPESMWCKKEIETFISLRGREHVLAVLIEGEPSESFPEELLYKTEEIKQEDGTVKLIKVPVEPLAADFRGKDGNDKKGVAKAMKTEILRVLAAMFGVPYDDLRQRHRERRMRRIVTASLVIGAVCLLFGIYSTMTAMRIKAQKEQIEIQSEQILQQSEEIQAKSEEIQKQNVEIIRQNEELALRQAKVLADKAQDYYEDGDNKNAVKTAVEALTESDGIMLPYTAKAQQVLTDSLRVYDTGAVFRAGYQYEVSGNITNMSVSPDGRVLAIKDMSSGFYLFDLEAQAEIVNLGYELNEQIGENGFTFLNGNRIAFLSNDNSIKIYDFQKKEITGEIKEDSVSRIFVDKSGKYLCMEGLDPCYLVYDTATLEKVSTIQKPTDKGTESSAVAFEEGILLDSCYVRDEEGEKLYTFYCWDIKNGQLISTCDMGRKQLISVKYRDGVVYTMSAIYADGFVDCDTYVTAISMESGAILWENMLQGEYSDELILTGWTEGNQLLCVTTDNTRTFDMQTGELTFEISFDSKVLESYSYTDSNNFMLILSNGELKAISFENKECYDLSNRLECKTYLNSESFHTVYGIVVHGANDNKITVYTAKCGNDVVESKREVSLPLDTNILLGEKAYETAKAYGMEKSEYVESIYFSEGEKYAMVSYWDNSLVIYDTLEKKVLNTIESAHPTNWHLGTDTHGYSYLLGYGGCYVLNQNMESVAWIPDVKEVDLENRKVYMLSGTKCFEAPVYTLEELLEMAENK
ncbi:MAG: TIR domain-containing protein [Lachnospiraceae bacterium]|nr:TIR domain-containing protein [Lachnospiraceae bacterium]